MRVAIESVFGRVVAGLNIDQSDIESRGFVAREGERASNVHHADCFCGIGVVGDGVSGADLDGVTGLRDAFLDPGIRIRPFSVTS